MLIYVVLAALSWSTIGIAARVGGDPLCLGYLRPWIAALLILPLYRRISRVSLIVGGSLAPLYVLYPFSVVMSGVGLAAFLLYTAPIWTTAVSTLYGERPGKNTLLGIGLVATALLIIFGESYFGRVSPTGVAIGLASGVSYGVYIAFARRYTSMGKTRDVALGSVLVVALLSSPLAPLCVPGARELAAGAYMALFNTVVPYILFTRGLRSVKASTASVVAATEPVFAACWGVALFGEVPSLGLITAYTLILAAAAMAGLERPSPPPRNDSRGR